MTGGSTQTPAGRSGRYPPPEDRIGPLLRGAPEILRSRGYEPAPKPYRPRRWRSEVWIGSSSGGQIAIALPAPSLSLDELGRRIGALCSWSIRTGRSSAVPRPDEILVLVAEREPVQLEVRRIGVKPSVQVVRVPGVAARPRTAELKPFRHELVIRVSWGGTP